MNQMRGLLADYGIVVARGAISLAPALALLLEDRDNGVSELLRESLAGTSERLPLSRRGKLLGLKPGLELCLCKPPGAGATLNQDSKWRFGTCVPYIND